MNQSAVFAPYRLQFYERAVTSRQVMTEKLTYFIRIQSGSVFGLGECALFKGLSADDRPEYESVLAEVCRALSNGDELPDLTEWSSIRFGLETALADLQNGGERIIFSQSWADGDVAIPINGLVWMGSADEMLRRIDAKLKAGFQCIKLKIGGIDFDEELKLLRHIREVFAPDVLEIRLDANGAFTPANAVDRLEQLAKFGIHSIEQPIRQHQWEEMARLCSQSPIPVALDEELIGISSDKDRQAMLDTIRPQYIILKPSLCGGFAASRRWIELACKRGIGWWITSALESNVGLNAIASFAAQLRVEMPQGLGTGMLYSNNIESPLVQTGQELMYNPSGSWNIPHMSWR